MKNINFAFINIFNFIKNATFALGTSQELIAKEFVNEFANY